MIDGLHKQRDTAHHVHKQNNCSLQTRDEEAVF